MIQRVYEQVQTAAIQEVVVATDDDRIRQHVLEFGGNVIMTSAHHQSGTDRCYEAYTQLDEAFDVVINIQGDEPFIQPEQVNKVLGCFTQPDAQIATLIKPVVSPEELLNPNSPKVVIGAQHQALYFSRHPIPYLRGAEPHEWLSRHGYYKHIGIYGYRSTVLAQLTQLQPSGLEKAESLEQLRWLEHGFKIITAVTELETIGIDTPADVAKALLYLKASGQ